MPPCTFSVAWQHSPQSRYRGQFLLLRGVRLAGIYVAVRLWMSTATPSSVHACKSHAMHIQLNCFLHAIRLFASTASVVLRGRTARAVARLMSVSTFCARTICHCTTLCQSLFEVHLACPYSLGCLRPHIYPGCRSSEYREHSRNALSRAIQASQR